MKKEVIEKLATLITAAFGLVAALAWNNAVLEIFKHFFGTTKTIFASIIYAILVTLIAVFATIWIGRISEKSNKK